MVALSFSDPLFVEQIRNGTKQQTTRLFSTNKCIQLKKGRKLQLYYRQRNKDGFKICDATKTDFFIVRLLPDGPVEINGRKLLPQPFGILDGFDNFHNLYEWLKKAYGEQTLQESLFYVVRWEVV